MTKIKSIIENNEFKKEGSIKILYECASLAFQAFDFILSTNDKFHLKEYLQKIRFIL